MPRSTYIAELPVTKGMKVEDGFRQTPPVEGHPFLDDPILPALLHRLCPSGHLDNIRSDLVNLGAQVIPQLREVGNSATPPHIVQYNQWGQRVDKLVTSESWRKLKAIAQMEGIIGIFYERESGDFSRVHGFTKILMMAGDAQVVYCPLSMTDGCARVLELFGTNVMREKVFRRLVSRDPDSAFTAGQWMTERAGGSDVSQTETTASRVDSDNYLLDGFKWFSSATDSDVALALARTGDPSRGSRSLSLFLIPLNSSLYPGTTDPRTQSTRNGVLIHRLKNKFGTQIVPTAELSLQGTHAQLIGDLDQGVKTVSPVLNITRVHSAIASVGYVRKALSLATSYASVRRTGPERTLLRDIPLHLNELAKLTVTYKALTHFAFEVIGLLGKVECQTADESARHRLRVLTPVLKAFCAEKGVQATIECMTALGGEGYMEENGIGRLVRDGIVEKIWEGTTSVLSLDMVRAFQTRGAIEAFSQWVEGVVSRAMMILQGKIEGADEILTSALYALVTSLSSPSPLNPRPALLLLGYIASGTAMLEHTAWSASHRTKAYHEVDVDTLIRWVKHSGLAATQEELSTGVSFNHKVNERLVYGSDEELKGKL